VLVWRLFAALLSALGIQLVSLVCDGSGRGGEFAPAAPEVLCGGQSRGWRSTAQLLLGVPRRSSSCACEQPCPRAEAVRCRRVGPRTSVFLGVGRSVLLGGTPLSVSALVLVEEGGREGEV